jgi:hypothetical protein
MTDALARMASWIADTHPNWKPDRFDHAGPNFNAPKGEKDGRRTRRKAKRPSGDAAMKALILTALERGGPQIAGEIAKRIRMDHHSVNAKLTRMFGDKLIDRAKYRRSKVSGRLVFVYALRDHA